MNKVKLSQMVIDCKQGKTGSERVIYEHFYSYGISISMRYSSNYEEAVEVLNDSFLKAFKNIKKLKEDNFRGWLRRIIINSATDYHRKNKKYSFIENDYDLANSEIYAEEVIMAQLSYEDLLQVVQQLTPAYRTVFNLYVMDGYKHEEIAKMVGISVGASKSNLSRARQMLKDLLKKTLNNEYSEAIG
ncbi:RNA polymerase sigma factor [Ekhidna sp.]